MPVVSSTSEDHLTVTPIVTDVTTTIGDLPQSSETTTETENDSITAQPNTIPTPGASSQKNINLKTGTNYFKVLI